jgi:subtilase family serine protease
VFRVDPDLRVVESDEVNNAFTFALVVQQPPPPPPVDLVPTACRISPANPTTSDRIFFYVTMRNAGSANVTFPSNYGMITSLSGGNYAGVTEGGLSLAAGASVEVYAYWPENTRATGSYSGVVATLDQVNRIVETDETNNSITCPGFTVVDGPKADLVITNVETTVSPVNSTTDYDFRITIKNQGNLASSLIQFPNRIAEGGSASNYLYPTSGFTLAPGASQTFTVPRSSFFNPAPGTHSIVFRVDPDLRVFESDETNNTFTLQLVIQP